MREYTYEEQYVIDNMGGSTSYLAPGQVDIPTFSAPQWSMLFNSGICIQHEEIVGLPEGNITKYEHDRIIRVTGIRYKSNPNKFSRKEFEFPTQSGTIAVTADIDAKIGSAITTVLNTAV